MSDGTVLNGPENKTFYNLQEHYLLDSHRLGFKLELSQNTRVEKHQAL